MHLGYSAEMPWAAADILLPDKINISDRCTFVQEPVNTMELYKYVNNDYNLR